MTTLLPTGTASAWCTRVSNFGIKAGACDCCEPAVILALGIDEAPTPLAMHLSPDMADELAAMLQHAAHRIRGGVEQ